MLEQYYKNWGQSKYQVVLMTASGRKQKLELLR